jgi:hypothetical protein
MWKALETWTFKGSHAPNEQTKPSAAVLAIRAVKPSLRPPRPAHAHTMVARASMGVAAPVVHRRQPCSGTPGAHLAVVPPYLVPEAPQSRVALEYRLTAHQRLGHLAVAVCICVCDAL